MQEAQFPVHCKPRLSSTSTQAASSPRPTYHRLSTTRCPSSDGECPAESSTGSVATAGALTGEREASSAFRCTGTTTAWRPSVPGAPSKGKPKLLTWAT